MLQHQSYVVSIILEGLSQATKTQAIKMLHPFPSSLQTQTYTPAVVAHSDLVDKNCYVTTMNSPPTPPHQRSFLTLLTV